MRRGQGSRAVFGWVMYDWANSAFATTVMAGFFPVFFSEYWSTGADRTVTTARLGMANSAAGIMVALLAPVLGAIADRGTARKRFLIFFAYMGAMSTCCLWFVAGGQWRLAIALYVLASIGFNGSIIFNDALLPSLAGGKRLDRISAAGYALGYLGGGLLFAVNVWMTLDPARFGLQSPESAVRLAFLMTGAWWAVFTLPLIMLVSEPRKGGKSMGTSMVAAGLRELRSTLGEIRRLRTIFLFLLAYWCYIDGVDTIVRMAVGYGLAIGLRREDLIVALLVTQFVGFPSAIVFGRFGARFGAKRSIMAAIAIYIGVCVWAAIMSTKGEFMAMAVMVGLVQGGIQALSRSMYARMIPEGRSAEYFGLYNMLGKFAAVIGPVLIAVTGVLLRRAGTGQTGATRLSILSISVLFIAGGILLSKVDEARGREEVEALSLRS